MVMVSLGLVRGMMHLEVYNAVFKILEKFSIPSFIFNFDVGCTSSIGIGNVEIYEYSS